MSQTPTSEPGGLARFLQQAQELMARPQGMDAAGLTALAQLALQLQLSREEVQAAGEQLGLSPAELHALVSQGHLSSESGGDPLLSMLVVLCFGGLLLIVGLGVGAYLLLPYLTPEAPAGAALTASSTDQPTAVPPAVAVPPAALPKTPPQLDPDLLQAVALAQQQLPREQALLEQLKEIDSQHRQQAWQKLLPRLPSLLPPPTQADTIKPLLAEFYARDGAAANAQQIRQALLRLLPPSAADSPDIVTRYRAAFWAIETAVLALNHPALPPQRARELRFDLEIALKLTLPEMSTFEQSRKLCLAALANQFFTALVETAGKDRDQAGKELEILTQVSHSYLASEGLEKLRAPVLAALQPPPMPPEVVKNKPPAEPVKEPAKPAVEPKDPPMPVAEDERLTQLRGIAKVLLTRKAPATGKKTEFLEETVNITFTNALACALAQNKKELFDELAANPPKLAVYLDRVKKLYQKETPAEEPNPAMPQELPAQQLLPGGPGFPQAGQNASNGFAGGGGLLGGGAGLGGAGMNGGEPPPLVNGQPIQWTAEEIATQAVRALESKTAMQRYQAVVFLARNGDIKQLPTHQAETLAAYVLGIPSPQEMQAVLPLLPELVRFPSFVLALADMLNEVNPSLARVEVVLSSMYQRKLLFTQDANWRHKCRAMLLEKIAAEGEAPLEADAVQFILRDLYRVQAKCLGLDVPADVEQTSAVLERLIPLAAEQLLPRAETEPQKKAVRDLKAAVTAATYLAANDLQKTALLQRVWAQMLQTRLTLQQPSQEAAITELGQELDRTLSRETSVLQQLRLTEQYILRLWLHLLEPTVQTAQSKGS